MPTLCAQPCNNSNCLYLNECVEAGVVLVQLVKMDHNEARLATPPILRYEVMRLWLN